MHRDRFEAIINSVFMQLHTINDTKGREYSGNSDVLSNFKRLSKELEITPQKVIWIYMTKHLDSIKTYVNKGDIDPTNLSEPIDGRISDVIMYLLFLLAFIEEHRDELCTGNCS